MHLVLISLACTMILGYVGLREYLDQGCMGLWGRWYFAPFVFAGSVVWIAYCVTQLTADLDAANQATGVIVGVVFAVVFAPISIYFAVHVGTMVSSVFTIEDGQPAASPSTDSDFDDEDEIVANPPPEPQA